MTIRSDRWIKRMCEEKAMIEPFFTESVKELNGKKVPSYGLTSYGYDIRMDKTVKAFRAPVEQKYHINGTTSTVAPIIHGSININNSLEKYTNPIKLNENQEKYYQIFENVDKIVIPPGGFILANTMEYFNIPKRVTGVCIGKSTLARIGILVLVTPLEDSWSGYLTLEIKNLNTVPVEIQTGTGIAQIQFFESDEDCLISYKDRGGKYMDQPNIPVDARL